MDKLLRPMVLLNSLLDGSQRMMEHCWNYILLLVGTGSLILSGCAGREPSQVDQHLAQPDGSIQAYGFNLDEHAEPQQVAWVLLKAIADDVQAHGDQEKRKQALQLQCRLAHLEILRRSAQNLRSRSSFSANEVIFNLIKGWAPIINYYIDYLDENFDLAKPKMIRRESKMMLAGEEKTPVPVTLIDYVLPSESRGGPAGLEIGVAIRIMLAKTEKNLWRVVKVSYGTSPDLTIKLLSQSISQPTQNP